MFITFIANQFSNQYLKITSHNILHYFWLHIVQCCLAAALCLFWGHPLSLPIKQIFHPEIHGVLSRFLNKCFKSILFRYKTARRIIYTANDLTFSVSILRAFVHKFNNDILSKKLYYNGSWELAFKVFNCLSESAEVQKLNQTNQVDPALPLAYHLLPMQYGNRVGPLQTWPRETFMAPTHEPPTHHIS